MKKTVILFVLLAATMSLSKAYSQTSDILTPPVGIGTSAPNADLHIHSAVLHEYGGGHSTDGPRDQIDEGYYLTTLRMTNVETGTGATHGFYLQLMDNEITMRHWRSRG